MKIAIIGPQGLPVPPVKGGAIETLIDVVLRENEKEKKLDIDVYTIYDKDAMEYSKKYKEVNFIYLCKYKKYIKLRNKFISLFRRVFRKNFAHTYAQGVCRGIKKNKYDKVLVEGDSSVIEPISKVISKDKIYLHIHHDPGMTNNSQFKKEINLCNKVIVVSNFIKSRLIECINFNKNIEVLNNCTNTDIFNKEKYDLKTRIKIRSKFGIKEEDVVLLFSGRPIKGKGIKELILAIKDIDNVKLIIAGSSGFGAKVKSQFEEELLKISSDMQGKVIFTGFIHNTELPNIHSAADIAVVPSIMNDSAPLVVLEYMASGLPLITTESGGIPELIDNECAIVVKRDEKIIRNLKEAIELLKDNIDLRKKMAEKAYARGQKFNENIYYNNLINIIEK